MRRGVAGALVLAAVVALFVAFSGGGSDAGTRPGAAATTPLWSVRRIPQPVVDAVGSQHLQAALDAAAPGAGTCFAVDNGTHTIAAHDPDTPLIGASTQKLFVAAAALSILGPDFAYQTKVVAPAPPTDGTVDTIWLVGAGDPVLTTADYAAFLQSQGKTRGDVTTSLESLADAVVTAGVQRIPGGIVGDDSRYDDVRYLPTWKDTYRTDGEIGPLGALTVDDGYATWSPSRKEPVADPARNAATELAGLLRARGVEVGSNEVASSVGGTAPAGAVELAQVTSPNLRSIVASMLSSSDNLTAELLTKELGVRTAQVGSTAAGVAATTAKLRELGVPLAAGSLVDGSGLDRGNRVTCTDLVAALALAARPELATLFDGLPVAGQSGTLYDQFLGTALVGNFRGKTGSLDGVSGLAGVLDLGRRLRFAFLDNGDFSEKQAAAIRVHIGEIVGSFPDAPPVDALVPVPQ